MRSGTLVGGPGLSLSPSLVWCLAEADLRRVCGSMEARVRPEKIALGSPSCRHTMFWHRENFLLEVQAATSLAFTLLCTPE